MTVTDPELQPVRPYRVIRQRPGVALLGYIRTTDPKVLGKMYIVTAFVFFMIGGAMALIMRAELARPGLQFLSAEQCRSTRRPPHHRGAANPDSTVVEQSTHLKI